MNNSKDDFNEESGVGPAVNETPTDKSKLQDNFYGTLSLHLIDSIDLTNLIPPPNPLTSTNTQSEPEINITQAPTHLVLKCVQPSAPNLPVKPCYKQIIVQESLKENAFESALIAKYPILRDEDL